jgi:hypothetical protein
MEAIPDETAEAVVEIPKRTAMTFVPIIVRRLPIANIATEQPSNSHPRAAFGDAAGFGESFFSTRTV